MDDVDREVLGLAKTATVVFLRGMTNLGSLLVSKVNEYKNGSPTKVGKQRLVDLQVKGRDLATFSLTDSRIKEFEQIANQVGVNYSVWQDQARGESCVIFQAASADIISQALSRLSLQEDGAIEAVQPSISEKIKEINDRVTKETANARGAVEHAAKPFKNKDITL